MKKIIPHSLASSLRCSTCNKAFSISSVNSFSVCCQQPLLVEYNRDLFFSKDQLTGREKTMWRYFELLPVMDPQNIVSLGEGMTPILPLKNVERIYGFSSLLLKDESYNPTGSFKARGISAAISKAKELGIKRCIIPTAGNAGGALAAYCAKAEMECVVVMPKHTPAIFKNECELYGANLVLVEGLINDCAKKVKDINAAQNYFDVSTLKEPYRLEGKKTMGFEIAEQLNWQLPDVIVYPAGGGTGLIGIWKAFQEMVELGWIGERLPRMIAVQSSNCAPVAAAFKDAVHWEENFSPRPSIANGLAVPFPFAMKLMLKVLHHSNGDVVTVTEEEIAKGVKELARAEGILLSPEGSAAWKGLQKLVEMGSVKQDEKILLLNTGSGYKYLENYQ